MIQLRLIRRTPKDINQKWTLGDLFVKTNNGRWLEFGYTLEDQTRDINKSGDFDGDEKKVYGETSIPFGEYEGQITYSPHFDKMLPLIKDVPHFKGIRIHTGNFIKDTYGCILVGYTTNDNGNVWNSKNAVDDLIKLIEQNDEAKRFEIEIM